MSTKKLKPQFFFSWNRDSITVGGYINLLPYRIIHEMPAPMAVPTDITTIAELKEHTMNLPPPKEIPISVFGFAIYMGFCQIEFILTWYHE